MSVTATFRAVGLASLAALVSACGSAGPGSGGKGDQEGTAGDVFLVNVSRPTDGTIRSTDGQIECGTAPSASRCGPASYAWAATATLTAIPDTGKMFGTWAGDCVGRGQCVLDTSRNGADKTVTAVFGEPGRVQHANWMDPATHGPEFVNFVGNKPDHFDCEYCHSGTFDGLGIAPSCNSCHARAGHAEWRTDCTFCHAAPPATSAHRMVPVMTPPALDACVFCHASTVDANGAIKPGGTHMDGAVNLVMGDGTGGPACAACHGAPPETVGHGIVPRTDPPTLDTCGYCHAGTVTPEGNIQSGGLHGNGQVDVVGGAGGAGCAGCHSAPPSTGAHLAHALDAPTTAYGETQPFGCGNCHPTDMGQHGSGVQTLNTTVVLPGGTTTAGAVMTGSGLTATCMVACHFPLGAPQPAAPIAWTAPGPLGCKDCHARIKPARFGAGASTHEPLYAETNASGDQTTCWSCHAAGEHDAKHVTGDAGLVGISTRDAACLDCHTPPAGPTGPSQVLRGIIDGSYVEKAPPGLYGWTDATSGDVHGAGSGAGFGGTLDGFVRGQAPLSCSACHAGHASGNPFNFAPVVNGKAVPSGSITRAGRGAENLCKACHLGENHAGCQGDRVGGFWSCHTSDPQPAGSACFMCHGHDGILHFPTYDPGGPHDEPSNGRSCGHCHSLGWTPQPPDGALTISGTGPVLTGVTATSATVSWTTNRAATTYVEYGIGTAGYVIGNGAELGSHSITLTGLEPSTTYSWRVRSTDAARSTVRSATRTFTTTGAEEVPPPDLAPTWIGTTAPNTEVVGRLLWYAVVAPSGTAVQYEVQLASDAGFTTLSNTTLARTDESLLTGNSGWITGVATQDNNWPSRPALGFDVLFTNLPQDDCGLVQPVNTYYFRVRARDGAGNVSAWSNTGTFGVGAGDPYGC